MLGGTCDWSATQKYVSQLSKAAGTCPWPPKKNSYYIAGLSYYAHQTDLRTDLYGKQNLITYMIDTQESNPNMLVGRYNMLYLAAKFGGFDDINNNGRPDLTTEWDKNGDGFPDNYFFASDPTKIEEGLTKAFVDILKRFSSGSAIATLSERSQASQVVIQPYFRPSYITQDGRELKWLGFLKSFWIDARQNFREDTVEAKILNIADNLVDKIFQMFFDGETTKAAIVENVETCTSSRTKAFDELESVFDSGCMLAQRSPNDRKIYYNRNGTLTSFTTGEASYFANIWKVCSNDPNKLCKNDGDCGSGATCVSANASCIIKYIRGEDNPCNLPYVKRPRTINISAFCPELSGNEVWKLGDIISSNPATAGPDPLNNYHLRYQDQSYLQYITSNSYKNRPTIVAVSANDGMLHIFRVGYLKEREGDQERPVELVNFKGSPSNDLVGEEAFAFIPRNALPYLLWYGNPNYCHVPTVDYRVYIFDAKIGNQWKTLLLGVMGFGGRSIQTSAGVFSSSIFVLDLTNWLNNNLSGTPQLLWERSLPDGTLTLSFPAVAKVEHNWYVLVGTGPEHIDQTLGETYTNQPKIYVFDLSDGSLERTVDVRIPGTSFAIGDIMPVDINNDYKDDVAYFGVYGKRADGRVYGALMKLDLRNWTTSQAFDFGDSPSPVFGAPSYTLDENGNFWVFFGTGRYLSQADKSINYTNYLIGFKHNWQGTSAVRLSDLTDRTGATTQVTPTRTIQRCVCDSSGCSNREVVIEAYGNPHPPEPRGWYIRLSGEAIYSQPLVYGGTVNTLSAVPPQDICSAEGSSKLYSLCYKTGAPCPRPTILAPGAVENGQIRQSINIGRGVPPLGMPFKITAGQSREYQAFLQVSTGAILKLEMQQAGGYEGRFLLWIEK
ncbi:MAG: pilus assembly protein [Aquificaceae bacterium]